MMIKRIVCCSLAAAIVAATPAYAGQWMQDGNGWWWQNDDGSYPRTQWQWIDGNKDGTSEKYYFDGRGYLLTDTVTPDGYQVNGDGAWTLNHIVQVKVEGSDGLNDWNDDWEIVGYFTIPEQEKAGENPVKEAADIGRQEDIDPCELAYRVAELVNEEREARGKAALEMNEELMENAAVRAEEAAEVFGHVRPDGRSCGSAITVEYRSAGENLHGGGILIGDQLEDLAKRTVNGWLNSPAHKKNMLDSRWEETGVGVSITGGGEFTTSYVVTQIFIKRI